MLHIHAHLWMNEWMSERASERASTAEDNNGNGNSKMVKKNYGFRNPARPRWWRQQRKKMIVVSGFYDHHAESGKSAEHLIGGERQRNKVRVKQTHTHTYPYLWAEKKTHRPNLASIGLPFFSAMNRPHSMWTPFSHMCGICYVCVHLLFFFRLIWFRRTDFSVLTMNFRYKRWWTRRKYHQSVVSSEPYDINNEGKSQKELLFCFSFWLLLASVVFSLLLVNQHIKCVCQNKCDQLLCLFDKINSVILQKKRRQIRDALTCIRIIRSKCANQWIVIEMELCCLVLILLQVFVCALACIAMASAGFLGGNSGGGGGGWQSGEQNSACEQGFSINFGLWRTPRTVIWIAMKLKRTKPNFGFIWA